MDTPRHFSRPRDAKVKRPVHAHAAYARQDAISGTDPTILCAQLRALAAQPSYTHRQAPPTPQTLFSPQTGRLSSALVVIVRSMSVSCRPSLPSLSILDTRHAELGARTRPLHDTFARVCTLARLTHTGRALSSSCHLTTQCKPRPL